MWKLISIVPKKLVQNNRSLLRPQIRLFLSDAFQLHDAWNNRLKSPILQKINVNDLFYELDHQFSHFAVASALDIDLLVNAVSDDTSFDEIEDVLYKLRLSPEAIHILPSTHHAFIRLYVRCGKIDDLMRVLDDRLNYGIFPDEYCYLLMMDTFIKSGNFRHAAKVSALNMLQESHSNPVINYMSLYSCHKYIENPVPWNPVENDNSQEYDDDEEVKVRVKSLRNPYFDDHFDLVDPDHLIGKTLTMVGTEINDSVGRTYKLIGLILHEKFVQTKEFFELLLSSKETPVFINDGYDLALSVLDKKSSKENRNEELQHALKELSELMKKIHSDSNLFEEGSLLNMVDTRLREIIKERESSVIENQLKTYEEWEINRARLLTEQIAEIKRKEQLVEVQRQKQLLQEKEEELFFFENEPKLDLIIEEKEKRKAEEDERMKEKEPPIPKSRKVIKPREEPPLESFFDENIPMKLVKTKL